MLILKKIYPRLFVLYTCVRMMAVELDVRAAGDLCLLGENALVSPLRISLSEAAPSNMRLVVELLASVLLMARCRPTAWYCSKKLTREEAPKYLFVCAGDMDRLPGRPSSRLSRDVVSE